MTNGTFLKDAPNCFIWDWNYLLSNHTKIDNDYCGLREDYQIDDTTSLPNAAANGLHGPKFFQFVLDAIDNYTEYLAPDVKSINYQNPLELGTAQQVLIKFKDMYKVNSCLIEVYGANKTMTNSTNRDFQYEWTLPSLGTYEHKIFYNDTSGNSNNTWANFTVVDTLPPKVLELNFSNPISFGGSQNITIKLSDPSGIQKPYIQILSNNITMNISGTFYYYAFTPNFFGNARHKIFANDSLGNWNSTWVNYTIIIPESKEEDEDDESDDEEGFILIPFGYFYLLFILLGVLSLIIHEKRVLIKNGKITINLKGLIIGITQT